MLSCTAVPPVAPVCTAPAAADPHVSAAGGSMTCRVCQQDNGREPTTTPAMMRTSGKTQMRQKQVAQTQSSQKELVTGVAVCWYCKVGNVGTTATPCGVTARIRGEDSACSHWLDAMASQLTGKLSCQHETLG